MYDLFALSGTLGIWQDNYCRSDFPRCERYIRSQRGESVAKALLPNGKVLALAPRPAR